MAAPVTLRERAACQSHFNDLCKVLGQPTPVEADPNGVWYAFEYGVRKTSGDQGFADVWMRGHFGWEYKGTDYLVAHGEVPRICGFANLTTDQLE